jgi:integrase
MTVYFDTARSRWRYDFVHRGKRYSGYAVDPETQQPAKNKTDARRIEAVLKAPLQRLGDRPAPSIASEANYTLAQAMATYAHIKQGASDWPNQVRYIRELLQFFGADTALTAISTTRVMEYITWAKAQPILVYLGGTARLTPEERCDPRLWRPVADGRTRTNSTINLYLIALRMALRMAHETHHPVSRRPLLDIMPKIPKLKQVELLPRPIPDAVLTQIVDSAPDYLGDAVLLVRQMGFRKAEVFALKRAQIDWQNEGIWLDGALTKGRRDEFVQANWIALVLLAKRWVKAHAVGIDELFFYMRGYHDPRPIRNPKRAWANVLRRLGIEGHTFHNTKASFVTAVAREASQATTQALARHTDYRTTQRYLAVADKEKRAALEAAASSALRASSGSHTLPSPTRYSHTLQGQFAAEATEPLNSLVGATGFEPATPRPPV